MIKKRHYRCFLILAASFSFSASLAQMSYVDFNYRANTRLFKELFSQCDSVIAYSEACSFRPEEIRAFILKNDQWQLVKVTAEIKEPFTKKAYYKILDGPTKILNIKSTSIRTLNDSLFANQFWNINLDSLNKDYYFKKNGAMVWTPVNDGCQERITYITQEQYISLSASNQDVYQKSIFTADRHRFIKCRNLFVALYNE